MPFIKAASSSSLERTPSLFVSTASGVLASIPPGSGSMVVPYAKSAFCVVVELSVVIDM